MRTGRDLATTNGNAHLAFEIDKAGVTLTLTRPPEGSIFAADGVLDPGGAIDTHAKLVFALQDGLRRWLSDFQVVLAAATRRVAAMLVDTPDERAAAAEIQTGSVGNASVEIWTRIGSTGGVPFGLWWVIGRTSLAVAVGAGRRRRAPIWHRGYFWGDHASVTAQALYTERIGAASRLGVASVAVAREALLDDLMTWRDAFTAEALAVAKNLGETILQATGSAPPAWPRFQPHPDDPSRCYVCGQPESEHGMDVGHCHPAIVEKARAGGPWGVP